MADRSPSDAFMKEVAESLAQCADDTLPWAQLERLARGTLTDPELRELEARALSMPLLQAAIEAHRPLSSTARGRIEAALTTAPASAATPSRDERRKRRWRVAWGALPAAAAAALLVLSLRTPAQPELTPYELVIWNQVKELRNAPEPQHTPTRVELTDEPELVLVLRPTVAHSVPVDARVFAMPSAAGTAAQATVPLHPKIETSRSGALRLSFDTKALPTPSKVVVLLGQRGALGDEPGAGPRQLPTNDAAEVGIRRFEVDAAKAGIQRFEVDVVKE